MSEERKTPPIRRSLRHHPYAKSQEQTSTATTVALATPKTTVVAATPAATPTTKRTPTGEGDPQRLTEASSFNSVVVALWQYAIRYQMFDIVHKLFLRIRPGSKTLTEVLQESNGRLVELMAPELSQTQPIGYTKSDGYFLLINLILELKKDLKTTHDRLLRFRRTDKLTTVDWSPIQVNLVIAAMAQLIADNPSWFNESMASGYAVKTLFYELKSLKVVGIQIKEDPPDDVFRDLIEVTFDWKEPEKDPATATLKMNYKSVLMDRLKSPGKRPGETNTHGLKDALKFVGDNLQWFIEYLANRIGDTQIDVLKFPGVALKEQTEKGLEVLRQQLVENPGVFTDQERLKKFIFSKLITAF